MKRILIGLFVLSSLVLLSTLPATALTVTNYPAGAPANGIGNTRHNMGAFGPVVHTNGTTEICVFCHTPHHTNTSLPPAPLWNRVNSATYTAYGTTLGGSNITAVGSVSLACLSCHDGVTTWDTIINAPGAGGVNTAGSDQRWRFLMPNQNAPLAVGIDHFDSTTSGPCATCHTTFFGQPNPAVRLNIGTDVSNDHPVSVVYNAGVASLRPTSTVIGSIDLTTGLQASASTAYNGNLAQNRWAIRGFISNTATIADLLKNGKVECSSCHDPHFKNLSWDETKWTWQYYNDVNGGGLIPWAWCSGAPENCTDGNFLRRVGGNTGSGVCRTCHNK